MTFLKANGIRGLVGKNDWPRYTEEEPEMYEQEELDKLFKGPTEEERLWYEFFLMTGMRDQEVMCTYWSDVNIAASTVRVSHKPDRNWTPKAYKEREIPIPQRLVKALKAWRAKSDKTCNRGWQRFFRSLKLVDESSCPCVNICLPYYRGWPTCICSTYPT
jgi:integrase